MIIDHNIGDRVYAVIPHPGGALVVVGIIASIHIEAGNNTVLLLTYDGGGQDVPLGAPLGAVKALRIRDGEPAMYEVEAEVIRIVADLLAPKPTAPPLADPAPAPPPMEPPVGSSLPVEF